MAFVDTPLPNIHAIGAAWGLELGGAPVRLHGGEESAAYRVGDYVVRVGAPWRSSARLEWTNRIALAAARTVREAVAPVATEAGTTVVRFDGRPVTVWPFVEGAWPDEDEHFGAAAELLARLHRSLAGMQMRLPPPDETHLHRRRS